MMKLTSRQALMVAAAVAVLPAPAFAKDNIADRADALAAQANRVQQQAGALANDAATASRDQTNAADRDATEHEDHHGFPWGLLGIVGLAGLLGLKRNDRDGRTGGTSWDGKDPPRT
jgi:hypothetical protein